MISSLFLKGLVLGFSIAMPVGPIAVVCIRHSLLRGISYGLVAGLGAALADTIYGVLAGYGMSLVCEFLSNYQIHCQLMGAAFLLYLGCITLQTKSRAKIQERTIPLSFRRVFLTTFFLTLTNPLTILGFMGIYAALGIGLLDEKIWSVVLVTGGIFLGSIIWWLLLSLASALIGRHINIRSTSVLNQISGTAFLAFGIFTALATLHQLVF